MNETTQGKQTVLIVEDVEENRLLIGRLLEKGGYLYKEAANGQEALEMLQSGFRPALILLDVIMPVMDGYEFLDAMNEDNDLTGIPVIMLTALDHADDVMKALKRGAVDYCTKPLNPDDMLATIERVLQR